MKHLATRPTFRPWSEYQLIGSPQTVAGEDRGYLDCGFNHLIVHTSTPGVPREVRHEWSARFAREVAPHLAAACGIHRASDRRLLFPGDRAHRRAARPGHRERQRGEVNPLADDLLQVAEPSRM